MSQLRRWNLPTAAKIGEREYALNTDYREVLDIISWLDGERGCINTGNNAELDAQERWYVALTLFYRGFSTMPTTDYAQAADYLAEFLSGGEQPDENTGHAPKLLDWQQDASLIVAGVNHAAGCEIRAMPYLHWWTFLAWFSSIGEGTLSTVVAIRDKLRRGKKLEPWELEFYRSHRSEVDLRPRVSEAERAERERLKALLG